MELILVGMPRNMDGSYGPAALKVQEFVAVLKEAIAIPIKTWDERLTSVQANRFLIQSEVRREQRREKVARPPPPFCCRAISTASPPWVIAGRAPVAEGWNTVKIKMTIAYDGTQYAGWQVQKTGLGVQQRIEEALHQIFGRAYRLHSSSRTDTRGACLGHGCARGDSHAKFKCPSQNSLGAERLFAAGYPHHGGGAGPGGFSRAFRRVRQAISLFCLESSCSESIAAPPGLASPATLDLNAIAGATFTGQARFRRLCRDTRNYRMKSTVRTLTRCHVSGVARS